MAIKVSDCGEMIKLLSMQIKDYSQLNKIDLIHL